MTRIFLIAGEASGDLHGALLAEALRRADPDVILEGVGGERMAAAGVRLVQRSEEMAVTGFLEVVRHLPRLGRILGRLSERLRRVPPDALIPIDYPDFNLRLAARAHAAGVPVIYYISPQVWAWRRGRIKTLRRIVRRMIVIFPFEEEIYRRENVPVSFIGHPLVDQVKPRLGREAMRERLGVPPSDILIAMLPGSRRSEIQRILPSFLETRRRLEGEARLHWALALAPGIRESDLPSNAYQSHAGIRVVNGQTYDVLAACDLALVASGTATLEGALLGTPMLVVYRLHHLTWQIARRIVRVPHIAMANLIAGERVVPEFVQDEAEPGRMAGEVLRWVGDADLRRRTSERLRRAAATLGPGGAPDRAARIILDEIRGSSSPVGVVSTDRAAP
jgi:lipid-A-disaccharide synthase